MSNILKSNILVLANQELTRPKVQSSGNEDDVMEVWAYQERWDLKRGYSGQSASGPCGGQDDGGEVDIV